MSEQPSTTTIPPPAPRKKRSIWRIGCLSLVGIIVLFAAISALSGGGEDEPSSQPAAPAATNPIATSAPRAAAPTATRASDTRTVRYLITVGAAGSISSITYTNAQGGIEQIANFTGDWDKVFEMKPGTPISLSGQNARDRGDIKCTIFVDGQVFKESSSSGAYVIASCSGLIPRR